MQVLAAARGCFLTTGVAKTTMEAVARTAGVSRQTVYKHHAGRRDLVEAAAPAPIVELADIIARDWDDEDPAAVFLERCAATVTAIRDDTELGVLLRDGTVTLHDVLCQPELWLRGSPTGRRGCGAPAPPAS